MSDFLVVGGGIIGLLLSRELVRAGARVDLVERAQTGSESSWAGAGIVSPLYPWQHDPAVTALADWSLKEYPGLAAALREESAIDPEYRRCGLLRLGRRDSQTALAWAQRQGYAMEHLDRAALNVREPALAPTFSEALWMPDVAQIRNPRLCQALRASLTTNPGARLREGLQVDGFEQRGGRVSGVLATHNGSNHAVRLEAEAVIVCAGAWSGQLLATAGLMLDVYPVKGQMLLYHFERPPIEVILQSDDCYLIPRRDGHLLVGATVEKAGFDKSTTTAARGDLVAAASRLLPRLASQAPLRQWAGLRPGVGSGVPIIGRVGGIDNLYVDAGHFRNGLLLAPASARLMADRLLGRRPILDPAPYQQPLDSLNPRRTASALAPRRREG